ncbi:hypothetical protein COH20_012366 [Aspergillus flavus]|uniref:Uncharacterized protein n=1 Tax=Aspergillus flavus TaxID=5059 RepID=A0AB74BWI9_ASPFL|nr:hypothetical protein COH20_012366 [Aspergillus flavus]RAQ78159.1 hypothetical protein COH21_010145 [Aspergillus flavus]RMZ37830.1 hypothetical protein CA14_004919 [Aspergillus flavus]
MSDAPAPVAEGSASRPRPSRRGGRGRGNRNHRRPQTQAPERSHDAQAAQPPTQQPSQVQPTQNSPSDLPADAPRSRRGPRRGRGGGRGGGAPSEGSSRRQRQRGGDRGTTSTGRRFEGRLTKPEQAPEGEQVDTAVDANDLGLRADAPAFVPGTQSEPVANEPTPSTTSAPAKKKPKAKNAPPPPPKVTTKSVAPDIATRIHEDIAHNLYESGRRTKVLLRRTLPVAKEKVTRLHLEPGAVLAVTFPKKCFHQTILAGAKKKLTRDRFLVFHHIHVDRPVHDSVKAVRIRAMRPVMLGPARHVQLWAPHKIAFAVEIRPPSVARIPIMKMDGAAGKSAGIFCRAASILAPDHATRVSVVIVRRG